MALRVVKVSWNSNDGFGNFVAEESFGVTFELAEDHGADFFRTVFFVGHFYFDGVAALDNFVTHELEVALHFNVTKVAADEALNFVNRVFAVGNLLTASHLAN